MSQKLCARCGETKSTAAYNTDVQKPDGLASYCRLCSRARRKEQWARATPATKAKSARCVQRRRFKELGITLERYESLKTAQHNACAICGGDNGGVSLVVDHDHRTGRVRGLLCTQCNLGVGNFKDSQLRLLSAMSYLAGASCNP